MTESGWTSERPTEEGYYWFYGWPFRDRGHQAELHLVKIIQIANGVALVTNGHYLYRAEGAYGMWARAELPELPPLPPEDMELDNYTYHTE